MRKESENYVSISEVRGRSPEDLMPERRQPRGVTPHPRSGVAAGRSYPMPLSLRPREAAGMSNPMTEARGGGREDQPHVQGAVPVPVQEGLEELSLVEGQDGWR